MPPILYVGVQTRVSARWKRGSKKNGNPQLGLSALHGLFVEPSLPEPPNKAPHGTR